MAQIPRIGLQRLQEPVDLAFHPEADLISAFIENSITARERTALVDHFSKCHDCREILSRALPERMDIRATTAASRWLSWPVLRWAGAVACVAVVGTAVTLHYESRSRSAEGNTPQTIQVARLNQKGTEPAPAVADTAPPTEQAAGGTGTDRRLPAPMREKKAIQVTNGNLLSDTQNADAASTGPEPKARVQAGETLEARTAPASAPPVSTGIVPGRAKEPEPGIGTDNATAATKQEVPALSSRNAMIASRAPLLPRWALTSDGVLQRSLDAGTTWETISVAPQSRLHALAANGFDIWVGGSSGALYHSYDAGRHWSQVQPLVNGEALTSDIIGVEFSDPQHGKISTSSLETWSTDDAGQHWQRH